jgi:hypothetical protein
LLTAVKGGAVDVSEPYFVVGGLYRGRGRSAQFAFSCFTFASSSTYFTTKNDNTNNEVLSAGAVSGIVIGAVLLFFGCIFIVYMIIKERKGEPLFMPLRNQDELEEISDQKSTGSEMAVVSMEAANIDQSRI